MNPLLKRPLLTLTAWTSFVYLTTLRHPFFFDDSHTIQTNGAIQTLGNAFKVWTSATYYSSAQDHWSFRPVITFTNLIAWLAGSGATWPFHLLKIAAMAGICYLLFVAWRTLFKASEAGSETLAAWTALIFAAHPANTEVMNYISANSTLFCGFFYLLAYVAYLKARELRRWHWIALSLAAYLLSFLSKEEGITLPAIVMLTEWLYFARGRGDSSWTKKMAAIYAAAFVAMGCIHVLAYQESSAIGRGSLSTSVYFMTQWRAWLHYMRLLVWPSGFNADNLQFGFSHHFSEPQVWLALIANAAIVITAWLSRKRVPLAFFCVAWFYIAISPASSVVPLTEPVNDHRMLLAYFGLIGLPMLAMQTLVTRLGDDKLRACAAAGLVIALFTATQVRNQVWSSNTLLWEDTAAKNPDSPRAMNNLALAYMGEGRYSEALALLSDCERVGQYYSTCYFNRAVVLGKLGKDDEAEALFLKATQLNPHDGDGRGLYSHFLSQRGRYSEAIKQYQEIDRVSGGRNLNALIGWAAAARQLGLNDQVVVVRAKALQAFKGHPALSELGL